MRINQSYKIFNVVIYLAVMNFFFIQGVYSEVISGNTKIVKYENRSITERHPSDSLYMYSVADLKEKITEIEKVKMPFNEVTNTTDPRWNDFLLFNKECKEYIQLVKSYFLKNEKGLSPTEIVSSFNSLLNDDGSTICKRIKTKVSLFDMYSPKEILDIFDKIGTYKYKTPVVSSPDKGYYELPLIIR
jgi:hypothetical protein